MNALPLAGRRILVTRAPHQAGKLSEGLRAFGAEPVEVPVLEIHPPENYEPLDRTLQQLSRYDWLILTSANTVRALVDRAAELKVRLAPPASLKVAAVGQATAESARKAGLTVSIVPEKFVAESLLVSFGGEADGKRILLARAAVARDVIPDALRRTGASVDVVDAYRNVTPRQAPELLRAAIAGGLNAATFTSSSSVIHLAEAARAAGIGFPLEGVSAISIGPITTKTLDEHNWSPAEEANPSDVPGLIAAVMSHFSAK